MVVLTWAPTKRAQIWLLLERHVILPHFRDLNILVDGFLNIPPFDLFAQHISHNPLLGLTTPQIMKVHSCCIIVFNRWRILVGCPHEACTFFLIYLSITNFFPLVVSFHVGIHFGSSLATSATTLNKPITNTSINSVETNSTTQINSFFPYKTWIINSCMGSFTFSIRSVCFCSHAPLP